MAVTGSARRAAVGHALSCRLGQRQGHDLGVRGRAVVGLDAVDADRDSFPESRSNTPAANGPPVPSWKLRREKSMTAAMRSSSAGR
ncbi:MAG: hypothetical protein KA586_02485 [Candidatus Promineofilum sp.]|nr:hypothetical protein [Promineifilum sp.]